MLVEPKEGIFLIPARSGSNGLENKNMRLVAGESLIQWTLKAARKSDLGFKAFVSSQSKAILRHGQENGAEPILRSADAASDSSLAEEVVIDFLQQPAVSLAEDSLIIYLQPTSPLRTGAHVREAYQLFIASGKKPVTSVVSPSNVFEKYLTVSQNGDLRSIADRNPSINRQSGEQYLYPNGAIYIFRVSDFHKFGRIPIDGSIPYIMDKKSSLDIDDADDLAIAEWRLSETK